MMEAHLRTTMKSTSKLSWARVLTTLTILLSQPRGVHPIFPWDTLYRSLYHLLHNPSNGPFNLTSTDPTLSMNVSEVVRYHGYPFENHTVITDDGYILELHRIPRGKNSALASTRRQPIIFVPALMADSGAYVAIGGHESAGFVFANAGYDVWLHNNRGTRYTRKHVTLIPDKQQEFWNFCFHEMGVYDLPAAIDYVLSVTKFKQVFLVGHSMGGAIISIFLSEKPAYQPKVKAAFLLSPAIYLGHIRWSLPQNYTFLIDAMLLLSDNMEVFPYNEYIVKLSYSAFVEHPKLLRRLNSVITLAETSTNTTTKIKLKKITNLKLLSGTNVKVLRHFLQMIENYKFTKYDYHEEGNLKKYNKTWPPLYILDNITVPVTIIYGRGDYIVTPTDISQVKQAFNENLTNFAEVPDETFGHFDFILSHNAKTLVYDTILASMKTMEEKRDITTYTKHLQSFVQVSLIILIVGLLIFLLWFIIKRPAKFVPKMTRPLLNETTHLRTAFSAAPPPSLP